MEAKEQKSHTRSDIFGCQGKPPHGRLSLNLSPNLGMNWGGWCRGRCWCCIRSVRGIGVRGGVEGAGKDGEEEEVGGLAEPCVFFFTLARACMNS